MTNNTTIVVISETDNIYHHSFTITYHQGYMPPYASKEFDSLEAAKASEPKAVWHMPDEDADGDIIAIAYQRGGKWL